MSLVVFDPRLALGQALNESYAQIVDIDANGITSINLDLQYRERLDGFAAYDYKLTVSTASAMTVVCDTSTKKSFQTHCAVTLHIRIPTFERLIIKERRALDWKVRAR